MIRGRREGELPVAEAYRAKRTETKGGGVGGLLTSLLWLYYPTDDCSSSSSSVGGSRTTVNDVNGDHDTRRSAVGKSTDERDDDSSPFLIGRSVRLGGRRTVGEAARRIER